MSPIGSVTSAFHTHRLKARKKSLEKIFAIQTMEKVWKDYVRIGLREQEILDLHDYNDFHWGRKQVFENLNASICGGHYSPQPSTPVRIEKKFGVTRTLVIPTPQDCVVLQCIFEHLLPIVLKKQPSKNSFFSRSHGFANPQINFEKDYIWFKRWAVFSKLRFKITSIHKYVCVTDIANYFDNIEYSHLRNIISSIHGVDEVTLDILFSVLDRVSWRPDYLPPPGRSLPQVHFDAPRLLAHVYLFEIDEYLKAVSGDRYVRWVDDITVPANSASDAKKLLRDLDQLLMTRGLRLNSGKTQLLTATEARKFFHQNENRYLDLERGKISKFKNNQKRLDGIGLRLSKRFYSFIGSEKYGQWDKIVKRYLTLFTLLSNDCAVPFASKALYDFPSIRESIFRYFSALGPSRKLFNTLSGYLKSSHALDDSSIVNAAKVFTEWTVSYNSAIYKDLRRLAQEISGPGFCESNPFYLVASLWMMAKYGKARQIFQIIVSSVEIWKNSEFLSRQIAALYPKIHRISGSNKVKNLLERYKFSDTISIFSSLNYIENDGVAIRSDVRLYVLNGNNKTMYSIQRFLICFFVISCKKFSWKVRQHLRAQVLLIVSDPVYIRVLNAIKN